MPDWTWIGAPTRNCTRLACLPSRRIADNALGASKMVGARRLARPRLPDPKSGGSAIPREPRAEKMASLTGFAPAFVKSTTTRQTGDLLHERQTRKLQAPTSKSQ